jgi:hypothetical protein
VFCVIQDKAYVISNERFSAVDGKVARAHAPERVDDLDKLFCRVIVPLVRLAVAAVTVVAGKVAAVIGDQDHPEGPGDAKQPAENNIGKKPGPVAQGSKGVVFVRGDRS